MRKIAVAAALISLCASSQAMAANSGFYVGAGITHDNVATTQDIEGMGFNGLGATVYAGYDVALSNNVFAGVEANFDLATAKAGGESFSTEADHQFGATARLGYNLNEGTALYGRVGYQRGRQTTVADSEKMSSSMDGFRFGGGVETALNDMLALRLEYNRTRYSLSDAEAADLAPLKGGTANNQFSVGLTYGF